MRDTGVHILERSGRGGVCMRERKRRKREVRRMGDTKSERW